MGTGGGGADVGATDRGAGGAVEAAVLGGAARGGAVLDALVLGGAVLGAVVGGGGAPAVVGEPTEPVPATSVVAVVAAPAAFPTVRLLDPELVWKLAKSASAPAVTDTVTTSAT